MRLTRAIVRAVTNLPTHADAVLLGAALLLPLLLIFVPVDIILAIRRRARERRVLAMTQTRCIAGHVVDLVGQAWSCAGCGLTNPPGTHVWARCRWCGTRNVPLCPCSAPLFPPGLELNEDRL